MQRGPVQSKGKMMSDQMKPEGPSAETAQSRRAILRLGAVAAPAMLMVKPAMAQTAASVLACEIPLTVPVNKDGKPVDFLTYLVPISDYTINDVWRTVGLRGTGSNDIVVDDVFVPEHRALSFQLVSKCKGPGQEVNTSPLYKLPFGSVHPSTITAPIIGRLPDD